MKIHLIALNNRMRKSLMKRHLTWTIEPLLLNMQRHTVDILFKFKQLMEEQKRGNGVVTILLQQHLVLIEFFNPLQYIQFFIFVR